MLKVLKIPSLTTGAKELQLMFIAFGLLKAFFSLVFLVSFFPTVVKNNSEDHNRKGPFCLLFLPIFWL